jgi:hypothetical protein
MDTYIILSCLFILSLLTQPYKKCRDIEKDLKQYFFDMNYHRNDVWLYKYYREKYQERLNFLLREKGISTWSWRIYKQIFI